MRRQQAPALVSQFAKGLSDSLEDYITKNVPPVSLLTFIGAAAGYFGTGLTSFPVPLVPCADGNVRIMGVVVDLAVVPTPPVGWSVLAVHAIASGSYRLMGRVKQPGDTDSPAVITTPGAATVLAVSYAYSGNTATPFGDALVRVIDPAVDPLPFPTPLNIVSPFSWTLAIGGGQQPFQAVQPGYTVDSLNVIAAIFAFNAQHTQTGAIGLIVSPPMDIVAPSGGQSFIGTIELFST